MPLGAGSVVAVLGARLEDDGFDRYDERLKKSRHDSREPVEVPLKGKPDERGFVKFRALIDGAERDARKAREVRLEAKTLTEGFDKFHEEANRAEVTARRGVRATLGAVLERTGFESYSRALDGARREAHRGARATLGADYDRKGFDAYYTELKRAQAESGRRDRFKAALGGDFTAESAAGFKAFERAIRGVDGAASSAGGSGGGVGGFTARLGSLGGSLGKVGPIIAGLIPILVGVSGAAIAVGSSLAAAAAGAAAVGVGAAAAAGPLAILGAAVGSRFNAIKEAYAAVTAEQDKSGAAATSNASAQTAAAQAIASAQQGLGDARRSGAESTANAEQALADTRRTSARAVAEAEAQLAETRTAGARSIRDAEQAVDAARVSGAAAVADAEGKLEEARVSGAEAVADAERNLATIRAQGAANVQAADLELASAQADARRAQDDLTDARARARRELQDLAESARDAAASEEGAAIALARAQERAAGVLGSPTSTALDRREALYNVRQAQDAVEDAHTARTRADEDAAKGTDTLRVARDNLAAADQRVATAEDASRRAAIDATRAVVDGQAAIAKASHDASVARVTAEGELRDARRTAAQDVAAAQARAEDATASAAKATHDAEVAVGQAAEESARATSRAHADVRRAAEEAARSTARAAAAVTAARKASEDASASQGAAADAAEAKLAKLSATERRLLTTFQGFSANVSKAFRPATDAIFGGVDDGLRRLEPLVDRYSGRFVGLGKTVGAVIRDAAGNVAGPEWTRAFDAFIATAQRAVRPVANAVGSALEAARNIATAAQPFVVELADGLERTFGRFAKGTGDVGKVRHVIGELVDSTKSWMGLVRSVGGLLITVFGGGKASGDSLVDTLTKAIDHFNAFLQTKKGRQELKDFFTTSVDLVKQVAGVLGNVVGAMVKVSTTFVYAWEKASRATQGFELVIGTLDSNVRNIFRSLEDHVLGFVTTTLGAVSTMATGLGKLPGGGKFKDIARGIDDARDSIDAYRSGLKKAAAEDDFEDSVKRQTFRVDTLREQLGHLDEKSDKYKATQVRLRNAQSDLNRIMDKGEGSGLRLSRGVQKAADAAEDAGGAADDAGRLIAGSFNALAGQFGIKTVHYNAAVQKHRRAANDQPPAGQGGGATRPTPNLAVGGIPNPGSGSADDHLVLDPSGRPVAAISGTEGIINRPQMGVLDYALEVASAVGAVPFGSLDELWGRGGMRHYAGGGRFSPVPGFPGEEAATSVIPKIRQVERAYPALVVTDAYDRDHSAGHKSPGHNVTGTAVDFAGPDRVMDAAVRALVKAGYLVGYDGRFGSQRWPGHGPTSVAGSNAHLHVEFGGKGAAIAGGSMEEATMRRVTIGGPESPMRSLLQAAANRNQKAGQSKLNDAVSSLATPAPGGKGQPAAPAQVRAWVRAGLALAKVPTTPANIAAQLRLTMGESGGNPTIRQQIVDVNSSNGSGGAIGFAQMLQSTFNAYAVKGHRNILNPVDNTASSARYQLARYGHLVGHPGYNRGGRLGAAVRSAGAGLRRFAGGGLMASAGAGAAHLPARGAAHRRPTITSVANLPVPTTQRGIGRLQSDSTPRYEALVGNVDLVNTQYSLQERRFNLDTEELVKEDGTLDLAAINKRAEELQGLRLYRETILKNLREARDIATRAARTYRSAIARLRASLKHAKKKDRAGTRKLISTYTTRLGDWQAKRDELVTSTIPSAVLDRDELVKERAGILATQPTAVAADDYSATDTTADVGASAATGASTDLSAPTDTSGTAVDATPVAAAPDPAEVAAQAIAMLASFQASRADLFGAFGSNIALGGAGGPLEAVGAAAGTRYFGAVPASDSILESGAGGLGGQRAPDGTAAASGHTIINNFAAPPPDPLTWTRGQAFEVNNL